MSDTPFAPSPLPARLSAEVDAERMSWPGYIATFHRWWARRSTVLARIATSLAITEQQSPDADFLDSLGRVPLPPQTLSEACLRVRDAAWHWSLRESGGKARVVESPGGPRVLDPFAGGGAIPVEASRLGCSVTAGDLSPVAHLILRCLLEFPQAYSAPASGKGSSANGTWAGLVTELGRWAGRVESIVRPRVAALFPTSKGFESNLPSVYLWFRSTVCPNCRATVPAQQEVTVAPSGEQDSTLRFGWIDGQPVPSLTSDPPATHDRGCWACLSCGVSVPIQEMAQGSPLPGLLACVQTRTRGGRRMWAVSPMDSSAFVSWGADQQAHLERLLSSDFAAGLRTPLTGGEYESVARQGCAVFHNLFSPRQLLVNLEYALGVREVMQEMAAEGIAPARADALRHYLACLVDHLAEYNSSQCGWNSQRKATTSTFMRHDYHFNKVYTELNPVGLVREWLEKVTPVIEEMSAVRGAESIYLGNSQALPFMDDHFDAIVTEPPYYDNIAYGCLGEFYAIWESTVLASYEPHSLLGPAEGYLESKKGEGPEPYRQRVVQAFREIRRVMKPGRKCCLFFTGTQNDAFRSYVELCQQAGLELFDVRSLAETSRAFGVDTEYQTCLIYLRKPAREQARPPLQARADSSIIQDALSGKRVMYGALAEMITRELPPEDIKNILFQEGRGTTLEQVMEVIAAPEVDPRQLLKDCFGLVGIRRIAQRLNADANTPIVNPMEFLLSH